MPIEEPAGSKIVPFWTVIFWGVVISIGIYFWAYSDWGSYGYLQEPVRGLAEAGFIAMVLAATVDIYLKTELAKDAIKLALGYVLPHYLKDEMVAIYSNALICENHIQVLTLSKLSNERVCVRVRVERTLKNISTGNHSFRPQLIVDEWLVDTQPSIIRAFGYKHGDQEEKITGPVSGAPFGKDIPRTTVSLKDPVVSPNETIVMWYETEEFKHINDVHVTSFSYSTYEPRVRIDAPDDIGWMVEFPHRMDAKKNGDTVVLSALLLPKQSILVRWWDKAAQSNWRKTHPVPPAASTTLVAQAAPGTVAAASAPTAAAMATTSATDANAAK